MERRRRGWIAITTTAIIRAMTDAQLAYHIKPFLGAFAAHVAAVMPTYSILENVTIDGRPIEAVGAASTNNCLRTYCASGTDFGA